MAWKSAHDETTRRDPMQEFADKIIAQLEQGVKPWVRPWDPDKCAGPQSPQNAVTGHRYSGINVLVLGMDIRAFQAADPRWATYHQAQEARWQVRKGQKSTPVFFYKPLEVEDEKSEGWPTDYSDHENVCRVPYFADGQCSAFHAANSRRSPVDAPRGYRYHPEK